jgi:hypothetical protein
MPVQPETQEDTVLYSRRNIYGDNDITVRMLDGASLNIWGSAYVNGQSISSGVDVKSFGAKGDGITNDTAAIQRALDYVRLAGGGTVVFPLGTYLVSYQDHPENSSYRTALVVGSNTTLQCYGATIKLANGQTSPGVANSIVFNYNISAGGNTDINIIGGVFDGNAANQTVVSSGLNLMRVRRCTFRDVVVKNCRGTAVSGANETFHHSVSLSTDVNWYNCTACCDDGGQTASGFSANSSTNICWIGCTAYGMTVCNGFTFNTCDNLQTIGCTSYLNKLYGFNAEASQSIVYSACTAGGETTTAAAYPSGTSTSLGNLGNGFTLNQAIDAHLIGCISRFNSQGANWTTTSTGSIIGGNYSNNGYGLGLTGASSTNVYVSDETTVVNNTTTNFALAAPAGNTVKRHGYIGNPTLGVSGTEYFNPYPYNCIALIQGGTVTGIHIDGTNMGNPGNVVLVPFGKSFKIFYSVIPTAVFWLA